MNTDTNLKGFKAITVVAISHGRLAFAQGEDLDATVSMTVIDRKDYDSDPEFIMECLQWARRHDETYLGKHGESMAMQQLQDFLA